jgi:transcriptional antiterminator Rof (Rho-off)
MGHNIDRCDVIDILEESVTTKRPVEIKLEGGRQFTDQVRDVVTEAGADYVDFRDHGRMPVADIRSAARAEQPAVNNPR